MSLTVSVYQKNGLCRGPRIGNANFRAVTVPGNIVVYDIPLNAQGGGPLSGSEHIYTVSPPPGLTEWHLRVASPAHQPVIFFVRDGETHEVWLPRE
jgi:hypothetical protein